MGDCELSSRWRYPFQFGFNGGAVIVRLGGYKSTYLLRSWYLTRWNFFVGLVVT